MFELIALMAITSAPFALVLFLEWKDNRDMLRFYQQLNSKK